MLTLTATIGSSSYLVASKSAASVSSFTLASGEVEERLEQKSMPVTIIATNNLSSISSEWLQMTIDGMLSKDDVLCADFLTSILFRVSPGIPRPSFDGDVETPLVRYRTSLESVRYIEIDNQISSGPYFLLGSEVHKVFKLYPDPYGAFMCGVLQSENDPTSYGKGPADTIPVPSRLYSASPSDLKPLSGKRLAVKDIYNIRGLKTSMGSRSYDACYGECEQTASAILKLIDQGAVIVAKAKTVQLASGLGPRDWIDYQCPFNPRGDGYLNLDCSSTGSAASLAAYEWLDYTVGSDSLGSMVGPAAAHGIFGLRPTQGVLPLDGSLLVSKLLDTPGHFSRNIHDLGYFMDSWYGARELAFQVMRPARIFFPIRSYYPYNKAKLEIIESFIRDFEKVTGVQRTVFDANSSWKEKASPHILTSIDDFLKTTLAHIQLHDCYHNNARFREDHEAKFGSLPYVEPMIQYKWDLGAELSKTDYDIACNEQKIFKQFLADFVFTKGTVMLLPVGYPETSYRDEYTGSPAEFGRVFQGFGFKDTTYSCLGGLPAVAFPVGQVNYVSKITKKPAVEPVSLMLLGPPGTDLSLIYLIEEVLRASGRPLGVKVGRTAF